MKPKAVICWCILGVLHRVAFAQPYATDSVLAGLEQYAQRYPQEKVYLHLDKPYYTVGDDIWFKGYVTIGPFNNLSGLSKILYVDLINPEDRVVQSIRLPLLAGVTMGDFKLADSLSEGNYRMRAYTNWMRNFDNSVFYDRVVPIGNARTDSVIAKSTFSYQNSPVHTVNASLYFSDIRGGPLAEMDVNYQVILDGRNIDRGKGITDGEGHMSFNFVNKQPFNLKSGRLALTLKRGKGNISKVIPIKNTSNTNNIQFFPESGHLIDGNLTKVAFKALKPEGTGLAARGYVEDGDGTRVVDFKTVYAGMGSFSFIPRAGVRYTARVTFEDGTEASQDLPSVDSVGYALAINNELEKNIFVQAFASDSLVRGQEVMLILQRAGAVFYAARHKIVKNETVFSIPREGLPGGVVRVTLFSPRQGPLAERTIFNADGDAILPLYLSTDKESYAPREKVRVRLKVGGDNDTNRIAALSGTVIDTGKVPLDGHRDGSIYASLLLSSDIKGYIETPEYYFEDAELTKRRQLDNVMLTHGWSRINWPDLLAGKFPDITYHPEQDLRISGTVTRRKDDAPVPNATVTVLSTGNGVAVVDTVTDENGRFSFDRLLFYDSTKFVVQARDERGRRNVDIHLDESPRQQVTANPNAPDATVNVNESISSYLRNTQEQFLEMEKYGLKEKTILLEEVKVDEKAVKNKVRHSSNLNGPGNADQVITAEEITMGCPTLDMCLQGRLLGVVFRNGVPYSTRSINQPMQIVVDGMFMEPTALSIINPFDVETIEVLRGVANTAIYGMRGGGGVLIITTKRGDGGVYDRDLYTPGVVTHSPQGYYEVREFYAPDYSIPADTMAQMRDLRTTVHWEPGIVTDEKGNAIFEFYTADSPGTYRILVEGVAVDGRLARAVHYITVK